MDVVTIVLACIGFVYAIYSLVKLFIEIEKAEKDNCAFNAPLVQWVIHGGGILLLVIATFIYYEKGSIAWLLFFYLLCNVLVDFVVRNTQIGK